MTADGRFVYLVGGDCHCDVCCEPGQGYLLILDAVDPTNLQEVTRLTWSDAATDVVLDGAYAYVTAHEAGLRIGDVRDPSQPVEVGLHQTGDGAPSVVVAWPYAFVSYGGWCQLLDVRDPPRPRAIRSIDVPGDIRGMTWYRDRLWLYSADDELLGYALGRSRRLAHATRTRPRGACNLPLRNPQGPPTWAYRPGWGAASMPRRQSADERQEAPADRPGQVGRRSCETGGR